MADDVEEIEASNAFPEVISFGDLKATHAEYDLQKIQKHNDLYEGGDAFRARIDRYLLKLQDEMYSEQELYAMHIAAAGNPKSENPKMQGEAAQALQQTWASARASIGKQLSARQARAWYPPIVAGLLDFMIAAVFQNPPALVPGDANGKKSDKEPKESDDVVLIGETISAETEAATPRDYWHDINLDVDGNGTSLRELLRNALLEILLNKRAYLSISFDPMEESGGGFDRMKADGGLDARLYLLKAADVDDWLPDGSGGLEWIRTHRCTFERSSPEKQPDIERHCWTYITHDSSYEYEISFPKGKTPGDEQPVKRIGVEEYSTGFPIVPIPCNVWVMERLADIALGLFNRQASLNWHLDKAAFSLLVLATKRALQSVVDSTLGAVRLDPADRAEFVSPNMAISDALMKDIDRWKDELHSAVQAMVLQAASKDTGDRASGVAKQRDFGALSTLLTPFAMALKESIATVARKILTVRKDTDVMLTIQGLDKFDVQSIEMKLANAEMYMGLPNAPKIGKQYALADATLAMMANAPTKSREKAIEEVQSSDMEAAIPPASGGSPFGKPAPIGSGSKPINQPIGAKANG